MADALAEHLQQRVSELVFTALEGGVIHRSTWRRRVWLPALRDAAIAEPWPRVHDLRHTAVSIAISTGANVWAVQVVAGHADPAITLRVYSHLFDADLDRVSERVDVVARAASQKIRPQSGHESDATVTSITDRAGERSR